MARWDPEAEERLRKAAIELFLEHGYEKVTVAQIADRAGLTRRTFSRYFTDKRDVLFAGSERLPGLLADALRGIDSDVGAFDAVVMAMVEAAPTLSSRVARHAVQRRDVIAQSPELQERGLTKSAAVAEALAAALRERGVDASTSSLVADAGVAIFRSGFGAWVDSPRSVDLARSIREASARLTDAVFQPAT